MRTTVTFSNDVTAAIEQLKKERSVGVSAAVNELIRQGLVGQKQRKEFVPITKPLGLKVDVSNIADVLETLDHLDH